MDLEVDRGDLHRVRVVDPEVVAPGPGEAVIRIDAFALTTNNITYGVFGDALRYWEFFPAAPAAADDASTAGWGRIPVWGFGEVVASAVDDVAVGERLFGFLPMSSSLTVTPGRGDERGFSDVAPHRAAMAGAYNRYARTATDPSYRADREDHQMLLYPLFFTSFLIDDFIADNDGFGAEQVVISSASSKTAIGVAHLVHHRGAARAVGLTSAANAAFVEGLGAYDEVRTYDDAGGLADAAAVYVDVAGDRDVLYAVHERLADRIAHSMTVGGTHWDHQPAAHGDLPGPQPEFFFAPSQVAKRTQEWGQEGLDSRLGDAWSRYADWVDGWIEIRRATGPDAVTATYLELLDGRSDPKVGHVCSLPDPADGDGSAA
ncbi:MAG: DUF2855 family protein [Acidimicrobiales bacterium]